MARYHGIKNYAQRKYVGAAIATFSTKLLRCHVSRSAHNFSRQRKMRQVQLRNAEVCDLRVPLLRHKNVARLDVTMNDALGMGVVECIGDFFSQFQGAAERELCFAMQNAIEGFAIDVL